MTGRPSNTHFLALTGVGMRQSRDYRGAAVDVARAFGGRRLAWFLAVWAAAAISVLTPQRAIADDFTVCGRAQGEVALAACSRVIASGTGSRTRRASAYNNRGVERLDAKEYDAALADFDAALRLSPDSNSFNSRGLVWRNKGDFAKAMADYDQAIRLAPNRAQYLANRGEMWRLLGDMERSLADLDRAVALDSRGSLAHTLRGDTFRYVGNYQRALEDFSEALRRHSGYPPAYVGRGLTYQKMGDTARARIEFDTAVTVPSDVGEGDIVQSARETARARRAAIDSGIPQPDIASAPLKFANPNSVVTPTIFAPRPPSGQVVNSGRRVALVIGNSAYEKVPALDNPQKDADAVAASLRNIGFETVTLAANASRARLIEGLRAFADEADKSDWALVYYAGHGIEVNGINYLIPVDAALKTDRDVQFEAIPLDQVMSSIDGARKLKLVVLDACRDNPFTPQMKKTAALDANASDTTAGGRVGTRSIGRGLGEVKVQGATLVVYAAKHGQTALDGEGGNSPFAVAMVQRIATPGVEINKIFRLVRDDVMEATAGRQEPYTYGSLPAKEDFFFVAAKQAP
jgi:tetratricopeptide (TPR) repeat protein